jgi:1-acyl-sn-glycerol-3-phosphate acyltransferase
VSAPGALFRAGFGAWVRWRIRRGLDGVWVRGLDRAREAIRRGPVVLAATHVSWWDGMLLFPLDDALGRTSRVWMDAANLERLPFFGPLGAIPLDDRGPGALRRSIRAAAAWLDRPERTLWVFPQGRQRPHWARPLDLRPGAAWIAERLDATLIPVAIAYGFRRAPVPAAVVSFGEPIAARDLEDGLVAQLDAADRFLLDADAADPTERGEFELLVGRPRAGGDEQGLHTRLLAKAVRRG